MSLFLSSLLHLYRRLPRFRGKYPLGSFLFRKLLNKGVPFSVRVNKQIRYHLPNSIENLGKEIIVNGEYERRTVQAIVTELHHVQRPVFFDIGANIGAISIPVAIKLPCIEIHAFEASPSTFTFLLRNFQHNGLPTANLHNLAIYSIDDRELPFYESVHHGKSSLAPGEANQKKLVRTMTIDAYCSQRQINRIDLAKVDVEGFEVEVFKGMRNLLSEKKVKVIYFECENWAEKAAGFRFGEALDYLLANGYEIFEPDGQKLRSASDKRSRMLWARPEFPFRPDF